MAACTEIPNDLVCEIFLYLLISFCVYVAQTQSLFSACCLRMLLHLHHYLDRVHSDFKQHLVRAVLAHNMLFAQCQGPALPHQQQANIKHSNRFSQHSIECNQYILGPFHLIMSIFTASSLPLSAHLALSHYLWHFLTLHFCLLSSFSLLPPSCLPFPKHFFFFCYAVPGLLAFTLCANTPAITF